ncbi:MAG: sigma-70 family RNA polymerase sigma factor [Bacteroidota bacterium]
MEAEPAKYQTGNFRPEYNDALAIEDAKTDPENFAIIYERYFNDIFRFIYHRVETPDIAADLTSQVFYNAMKAIGKYTYTGVPLLAWLYKIARNEINQEYRKKKITRVVSAKSEMLENITDSHSVGDDDRYDILMKLMTCLDDNETELIEMKFFEGMSYNQMSDILDISPDILKMRVHRIKDKLKQLLKSYAL